MKTTWEIWTDSEPARFAHLIASFSEQATAENELKRLEDQNPMGKFKILRRPHLGKGSER